MSNDTNVINQDEIIDTLDTLDTLGPLIINQRSLYKNYKINYYENLEKNKLCVIYFSSNGIIKPVTKEGFKNSIINKDYYEWEKFPPIEEASKNIFLRDTFRQWYIAGINKTINNHTKLYDFLYDETKGYDIITVGASSGGYAAILYGVLLKAKCVFSFNPQTEINSFYQSLSYKDCPLLYKYAETNDKKLYDLKPFITGNRHTEIFMFVSIYSKWDNQQYEHIKDLENHNKLNIIKFKSYNHGIPFPKVLIKKVIAENKRVLKKSNSKIYNPILFGLKLCCLFWYEYKFITPILRKAFKNRKYIKEVLVSLFKKQILY